MQCILSDRAGAVNENNVLKKRPARWPVFYMNSLHRLDGCNFNRLFGEHIVDLAFEFFEQVLDFSMECFNLIFRVVGAILFGE